MYRLRHGISNVSHFQYASAETISHLSRAELLSAPLALVGFLSRVGPPVVVAVRFDAEAAPAQVARMGLLPRVDQGVRVHGAGLREAAPAYGALVRFDARVNLHVLQQSLFLRKLLVAHFAHQVLLLARLVRPQMLLIRPLGHEPTKTHNLFARGTPAIYQTYKNASFHTLCLLIRIVPRGWDSMNFSI